jgi:hypothetical protein
VKHTAYKPILKPENTHIVIRRWRRSAELQLGVTICPALRSVFTDVLRSFPAWHRPGFADTALMQPGLSSNETVRVTGISNREFLERYAQPGHIGLSGGVTLIDKAICRAERHLDSDEKWGSWSHAFLFQGRRLDGHHWVIESDMQVQRRHIQLGLQENRISKYFDDKLYTTLAVLDFGLNESQVSVLLREGLELVATRARYSLRELVGTLIALRRPTLRSQSNVLARERSLYCSALVQHLFRKAGLDLAPGVDLKNTTPEDIARTSAPHVTYLLDREAPPGKLERLKTELGRMKQGVRRIGRTRQN